MCDTHEGHTDVISYLTANALLLNYAENLLMLHVRTVAVYSENNTKDTNRRVLCSCVVQQVTVRSVTGAVFLCGASSDGTFCDRCCVLVWCSK